MEENKKSCLLKWSDSPVNKPLSVMFTLLSDIDKRICNEQRSTGIALHGPINITCIPFLIFVLQVAFRQLGEAEEVTAVGRRQLTAAESSANASVASAERRVRDAYGWLYHLLVAVASYQTLTDNVFLGVVTHCWSPI